MKFSNEMIEKAKTAKSVAELLEMAKAEHIELTEEQAAKAFVELNKTGELSDEELDNVAGGCGSQPDEVVFRYEIGQIVDVYTGGLGITKKARITDRYAKERVVGGYIPWYKVTFVDDGRETDVRENHIAGIS